MPTRWFARLEPSPDVFSTVMASGIVAIAAFDHQYWRIGMGLKGLATVVYVLLGVGFVLRAVTQPRRVLRLTRDPDVALRMFTFVAACAVLASIWQEHPAAEWALAGLALAGWLVLAPLAVVDIRSRPVDELRDHAHGAWLLPSVATQGLSITASDLAAHTGMGWLLVFAAVTWMLAVLLYLPMVYLIAWRALAAPFRPDEVTPDSWILMGALAIAALAGGDILRAARSERVPENLTWWAAHAATLAPWIVASLWIPPLLYAEVWRADQLAGSLRYAGVW